MNIWWNVFFIQEIKLNPDSLWSFPPHVLPSVIFDHLLCSQKPMQVGTWSMIISQGTTYKAQGCYKLKPVGPRLWKFLTGSVVSRGKWQPHSWCLKSFSDSDEGVPREMVWPVGGMWRPIKGTALQSRNWRVPGRPGFSAVVILSSREHLAMSEDSCHTGGRCSWHQEGKGHQSC